MKKITFIFLSIAIMTGMGYAKDSTLVIGIKEAPPFIDYNNMGKPGGLSVDFWKQVNSDMRIPFTYKRFGSLSQLINSLEKGEIDMSINPITVTDQRMKTLDFSQPFFISGTAIARKKVSRWKAVMSNLFSWQFFSAILALVGVIFIFGLLLWLVERRKNPEQFADGIKGLGDGFWWSAVTMTTVGYGDKAPVSRLGRLIGLVWMFAAILMISGLTASIASALTVSSLNDRISTPEDLRRYKVATIDESSSEAYLSFFDVNSISYRDLSEALQAVNNGEIDMVVYDRPILQHYIEELGLEDISLKGRDLKTDYYSFSFPPKSPLRDVLDPQIVRALKSPAWSVKLKSLENEE